MGGDATHIYTMTAATPILLLLLAAGALGQSISCYDRCGVDDGVSSCQCNSLCVNFGDCCSDYESICLSCQDRCGEAFLYSKPCQCNEECGAHGNCCEDYDELCSGGGGVTDSELRAITEYLFAAEVNSVYDQLTLDHQGMGSSGDLAPGPLFVSVPPSALSGPTISLLMAVQDNYYPSVSLTEHQDAHEIDEQNAFLDAVMNTEVMQLAESFLQSKNLLTGSLRDTLNKIWFTLYNRGGGVSSSSGFEHVYAGELDGKVSGFHNWVKFQEEESEGDINYMGYTDVLQLGEKGEVIMHRFNWMGAYKNVGSMFVGTSPELEMATYTVCFLARPNQRCPVQMAGQQFEVQTYTIFGDLVGSAYPDI